jgi:hypothetical protein
MKFPNAVWMLREEKYLFESTALKRTWDLKG